MKGSRSNVLPGALVFGIFGMLGQGLYNSVQTDGAKYQSKVPYTQRLLDSRWVPLKRLSDEDYVGILHGRAIKIEAEIAIIDEKIAALQECKLKAHLAEYKENHIDQANRAT